MKKLLLPLCAIFFAIAGKAQVVEGSVTLGAGYTDQAYYKLSTETETDVAASSWDVAFYRMSSFSFGTRINAHKGIEVYEVSIDPTDYSTVDIANESSWTRLYNSETDWVVGAFDNASYDSDNGYALGYGWGEYNMTTHHITGKVVFALVYPDGTYRKFMIEDFYGGYTFKYATYDADTQTWSDDTSYTLANSASSDTYFNYYSLEDDATVAVEPTDWDLLFTKYNTDYYNDGGSFMYNVTGVLQNPNLEVAMNDESSSSDTSGITYSTDINTIGYDWKTFNMTTFAYDVNSDMAYYIKYEDETIYRLVFTDFEGSSTGVVEFEIEDVTSTMDVASFDNNVTFGVYPNPSLDKKVTVLYDVPNAATSENQVAIYNLNGAMVFQKNLTSDAGFYRNTLNLSALNSGVYILKFTSGDYTETKKLILK
ncbi:Por secretion system C-terminal sorting domain-containing protein [Pustulibacterium marinum]|uniref:Por secretion system C-terminal sorting domain-containing protein n=1 Tax=Pustulibacterium marinum TaxID=1224947 RepID=A0A1I7F841_9FLAO|nr:T9SS type A sorting domain-containing protein [Pustulibacterium marinum]SFU32299.1 Por secretion system C-terminal sorting domain-containing protein [Pustulibacterium marinum]